MLGLSLCTSQRVGATDKGRMISKATDLAEENEVGVRVVEKRKFCGMPANMEKYKHQLCYICVWSSYKRNSLKITLKDYQY